MRPSRLVAPFYLSCVLALGCGAVDDPDGGPPDAGSGTGDGGSTQTDAGPELDGGTASEDAAARVDGGAGDAGRDAAIGADAGPPTAAWVPARWITTAEGASTLGRTHVAVLTDGTVVGAVEHRAGGITFGEGESGETTFTTWFQPDLAFFDGADGHLLEARQIAIDTGPTSPGGGSVRGLAPTWDGGLVMCGEFTGTQIFHEGLPGSVTWTAERRQIGDTLHRAEDPWIARLGSDRLPDWSTRGQTPGPITRTWFNYAADVTPDPIGDGAFMVGQIETSGMVLGPGTSGATTLAGSLDWYFARLDATGAPTFTAVNENVTFWDGVESTSDGGITALGRVGASATLLSGTADATPIALAPASGSVERHTYALVHLTAADRLDWVRRIVVDRPGNLNAFATHPDGSTWLVGRCSGSVSIEGGAGGTADVTCAATEPFAVRVDATGTPHTFVTLGVDVDVGAAIAVDDTGRAWIGTSTSVDATSVPFGVGTITLPAPPVDATGAYSMLHVIDAGGALEAVHVTGINLWLRDLAHGAGGTIAGYGLYYDASAPLHAWDGTDFIRLPAAADSRAFWARFF